MHEIEHLAREYAEACRRYKEGHVPFIQDIGGYNAVTHARNELLRAILDWCGLTDVEIID